MKNKTLLPIALITAFAVVGHGTASAAFMQATTFTLTTNSKMDILIFAAGNTLTASSSGAMNGAFTSWISCDNDATFGDYLSLFSIESMDIDIADNSLTIPLGGLGGINAGNVGYHLVGTGPHLTGTATATGTSTFDPGGTTLGFDSGMLTFAGNGSLGGLLGTGVVDFTIDPAEAEIPTGAINMTATLTATADPEKILVSVSIPIFAPIDDFVTDPIEIDVTLAGLIEATGIKMITVMNMLPGDVDGDGDVDFQDFLALQIGFGTTSGADKSDGDLDGDGDVDFQDFLVLQVNFGNSTDALGVGGGLGGSAVPEPGTLILLGVGFLGLVPVIRKRLRKRA